MTPTTLGCDNLYRLPAVHEFKGARERGHSCPLGDHSLSSGQECPRSFHGGVAVLWLLALIGTMAASLIAAPIDLSNAKVVVVNPASSIETKAVAMLVDEVEKRTRLRLEIAADLPTGSQAVILVGTAQELAARSYQPPTDLEVLDKPDAYALWVDTNRRPEPTLCVAGYDCRGALFGVGQLLRLLQMERDQVRLESGTKLATAPRIPLRGHQMGFRPKTNSYDGWTLAMWEQYLRDMIVFGMNAVELIPPRSDDDLDSPHFPKPPMDMMVAMSRLASEYGLDVWIWYPAMDKDYSSPDKVEFALKERDEVFKQLPRIDAVFVPGGDPGETRPDILLSLVEKTKTVLNRHHPKAEIWVSPQGFDRPYRNRQGWLKMFYDLLRKDQPKWLDGVVFGPQVESTLENLRKEVPARYPIRNYPDITHSRGCQYPVPDWDKAYSDTEGRECINPRPISYARIFHELQPYTIGFVTYSEGCNDDFNKVLWSCLGWDPEMKPEEITSEYSRYFISARCEGTFSRGLLALEQNWEGPLLRNDGVDKTLHLFQEMERNASPQEKLNWRCQQGLYRAYYDAYIRSRLVWESGLRNQALDALRTASQSGSLPALEKAESILAKAGTERVAPELRARVFELAEALFQSIRMQLSVEKYQAIAVGRGANLDEIDKPLNSGGDLKKRFSLIRKLPAEPERLAAIAALVDK